MSVLSRIPLLLLVLFLTGCTGMKLESFADSTPKLLIEEYFLGRTYAWGVFEDRFGTVRRQFQVTIDGKRQGDLLTLDEAFRYADGQTEQRIWRITIKGQGRYTGIANDIAEEAVGHAAGNALRWRYAMALPVGDRQWIFDFDDWMWLQPGGVLINRTTVSKWGIEAGRVTIFFSKQEHTQ